jgi:hypothetical protein
VSNQISRLGQQQRGDRAPHSQLVPLGARALVHGAVRVLQRAGDALVGIPAGKVIEVRALVADHLHRHFAGNLARRVPTHAVRDDEQPTVSVGGCVKGVLIPLSNPADVGAGRNGEMH